MVNSIYIANKLRSIKTMRYSRGKSRGRRSEMRKEEGELESADTEPATGAVSEMVVSDEVSTIERKEKPVTEQRNSGALAMPIRQWHLPFRPTS